MFEQNFFAFKYFHFFVNTDFSVVIIISCCLNHYLDLKLIAVAVLQSIINHKARSSPMYIPVKSDINYFPYFLICSFAFVLF